MTKPSDAKQNGLGHKWSKYPHKDLLSRWARDELSHAQAIGQLLLWSKDTHDIAAGCNQTQFIFAHEQRALAQDHQILLQKYEALAQAHAALQAHYEEQTASLIQRVRVLEYLARGGRG